MIPSKQGERENSRPVSFDKTALNFGGMVKLAFIHGYLHVSAA